MEAGMSCPRCAELERALAAMARERDADAHLITDLTKACDISQDRAEQAERDLAEAREDAERLIAALNTLIGTCEIAAVMPDAIGKALVLQWDSPELNAARAAIDAARKGG